MSTNATRPLWCRNNPRNFVALFLMLLAAAVTARGTAAQPSDRGFYIRQALDRYFTQPDTADNLGQAGSAVNLCDGSACLFMNPARLGFLSSYNVELGVVSARTEGIEFLEDDQIEESEHSFYFTGGIPLSNGATEGASPDYGTLAVSYSRYNGETDDAVDSRPDGHRRAVAYGLALTEDTAIGYSFTFYDDQLRNSLADLHSHSRFLHIFGASHDFDTQWRAGATFKLGIGQSDTEDFAFGTNALSHLRYYSGVVTLERKSTIIVPSATLEYSYYRSRGNLDPVSQGVVFGGNEHGNQFDVRLGAMVPSFDPIILRTGARYRTTDYEFERSDVRNLSGSLDGMAYSIGIGYLFGDPADGDERTHIDYGVEYDTSGGGAWLHLLSLEVSL